MNPRTDLSKLDRSVRISFYVVSALVLFSLVGYFTWFSVANDYALSSKTGPWGEFGDFVGGVLNPLVAYSAFYWLSRSVLLQKEELLETREALQESAASQAKHAAAAELSIKIAGFTALLNEHVLEVQSLRQQSSALIEQASQTSSKAARLPNGEWVGPAEVIEFIKRLDSQISYHSTQRVIYERALKLHLGLDPNAA